MTDRANEAALSGSAPNESSGARAWCTFRSNKAAFASLWGLAFIVAIAVLGPLLSPNAFDEVSWDAIGKAPSLRDGFIFGTDFVGRDLFVRTMTGLRLSLTLGLFSALVSLFIGVTYGAVAGYFGGRLDNIMMRIVDALYAIPFMFFVIIIMVLLGRNILLLFIAIGAVQWLTVARIIRAQTMAMKSRGFVTAAIVSGASQRRILWRHITPNLLGILAIYLTLTIPDVILIESFLSFLGLGVQEPLTSLGVLISQGAKEMYTAPWLLIMPAVVLCFSLLCLNLIGDGLRDALDPKDVGE